MSRGVSRGINHRIAKSAQKLRRACGETVRSVEQGLARGESPWYGSLSKYIHEPGRKFPASLGRALDEYFAQRLPEYPTGLLAEAIASGDASELEEYVSMVSSDPPLDDIACEDSVEHVELAEDEELLEGETENAEFASKASSGGGIRRRRILMLVGGVLLIAALGAAILFSQVKQISVHGFVSCASGKGVVGVWVASADESGSFAALQSRPGKAGSYFIGKTSTIPYSLHIGCGGTSKDWEAEGRTPQLTVTAVDVSCNDLTMVETPVCTPQ